MQPAGSPNAVVASSNDTKCFDQGCNGLTQGRGLQDDETKCPIEATLERSFGGLIAVRGSASQFTNHSKRDNRAQRLYAATAASFSPLIEMWAAT
jgi:hypothetical protein